jgi:uncharacterized OB-fold protein
VVARVAVEEGLFEDSSPPVLLASRCLDCAALQFPRQATCPFCAGRSTEPVTLAGPGRLWVWTAVTAPPPGYRGGVPYGFGVVELGEGVRIVTRLTEPDPSVLARGQAMRLEIVTVAVDDEGNEVRSYAFAPAAAPPVGAR